MTDAPGTRPARGLQAPPPPPEDIVQAIRTLGGRATIGDLATQLLVPSEVLTGAVLPALSLVGGHVAVDEGGNLIFAVDRRRRLPDPARWRGLARALRRGLEGTFIALLSIVLVAYFAAYVVLLVVLLFAAAKGGGDCSCDCSGCDSCNGSKKQAARAAKRSARAANPRASDNTLGQTLEAEEVTENPKFVRAVHAFIFGPLRPRTRPRAWERNLLGFIRAHQGRITAADAALLTGLSLDHADTVLLDLAVRYNGDVEVAESAALVYTFDELMVSAGGGSALLAWILERGGTVTVAEVAAHANLHPDEALARLQQLQRLAGGTVDHGETTRFRFTGEARAAVGDAARAQEKLRDYTYCWDRLERAPAIVGIPKDKRGWIIGFNIVNLLVGAGLAIYYLNDGTPLLDLPHEPLWFAYLPLSFSLAVFVIPLTRWWVEALRNRGRSARNAHRLALAVLAKRVAAAATVTATQLANALGLSPAQRPALGRHLERFARELDGHVDLHRRSVPGGDLSWSFQTLHDQLVAARRHRAAVDPRHFELKTIAYDTAEPMD